MSEPTTITRPDYADQEPASAVEPIPPRYWWLKRILWVSGVLLVALVCVRLWWGWDAHRRLEAEIDRAIAAGDPVYPADFDSEPVPAGRNAAKFLTDATMAVQLTLEETQLVESIRFSPNRLGKRLDEMAGIIQANAKVYDLVHQARDLPEADWGIRMRSPMWNSFFPGFSAQRSLSKLLATTAIYQHFTGDHAGALATLHDGLGQARTLDHQPTLIAHLVAIAMRSLLYNSIELITPSLAVDTAVDGTEPIYPASRNQVRTLISTLLDERVTRNTHIHMLQCERAMQLDIVQMVLRGDASLSSLWRMGGVTPPNVLEQAVALPFKPILELDGLWAFQHMTAVAHLARKSNWPAVKADFPPEPDEWSAINRIRRPLSSWMLPSMRRATELHYKALALRRMTAAALAIRLYELDHGSRSGQLADLVPDFLPAVPLDPFAADGRPIGYKPEGTPAVLYSIGEDGVDDGGDFALRHGIVDKRNELDIVFFLNGDRPRKVEEEEDDPLPDSKDEDRNAEDQRGQAK